MTIRPDSSRFWGSWRRRFPRLVVIFAGALMITVVLAGIDWSPLQRHHVGWLVTIAAVLVSLLWLGLAFAAASLAFVAVALRIERIEVDSGTVRRWLVFGRTMVVPLEGATLTRTARADIVTGGKKRLVVPHMFYAPEQLDRFWESAGLGGSAASADPR